ncbi:MAG: ATP-dependent Clp protease ATP-binding subunit [Oscillospiraceae bacterium]
MLCTKCKKRMAVIFMSHLENGKTVNEGLCLQCAKEMGIPQVKELIDKMGISDDDIENMNDQMMELMGGEGEGDDFEMGGAQQLPFLQNIFGGLMPADNSQQNEIPEKSSGNSKKEPKDKEPKKDKKDKKRKFLDGYCENLTTKAREGKIDKIVGRDEEIYRVLQILNRRSKNNPCLIGEPGVGKTAIAEGIAQRLADGNIPPRLADKQLYLLDLTGMVAGTQFRGQFESRVKGLIEDIKAEGNVILFIDEVHNLVGAGDSEGSMNAANILKPALSRGEIQVIGATTFTEYRKNIEKDAALERRFQPVKINEPSIADSIEVIKGIKKYYESYHRVKVSDDIAKRTVVMSERYINDRFLPDKAIDLLDEACSCCTLENKDLCKFDTLNRQLKTITDEIEEKEQSNDGDYEKLANLREEKFKVDNEIKEIEASALGKEVTVDDLARVVELWTGIPASKIKEKELKKVAGLAESLKTKIIGQDDAVELVAKAVLRSRVQISARKRPASFIFVGPTGVGKTELVKVLSKELFDDTDPLIRLDMSEFMEKHSVSRIVGSPPGYVGYDEAGQLTEKVRRRPYSVVLFDEIEKAHPDVLNILLQILDEGKITDAHGRTVSFENTVIVMTSNAGSNIRENTLGFDQQPGKQSKDKAIKSLNEFLRPEFVARVDEIVVFRPLDENDYKKIAVLMLNELRTSLLEKETELSWNDEVVAFIAKEAFGNKNGARAISKVVRKEFEDKICSALVELCGENPNKIEAILNNNSIEIKIS